MIEKVNFFLSFTIFCPHVLYKWAYNFDWKESVLLQRKLVVIVMLCKVSDYLLFLNDRMLSEFSNK